jgi:hypothetical protein
MRWPRVRFTVRRLMVAVAIVALAFGVGTMRWRQLTLRAKADHHERIEREQGGKQRAIEDLARAANTPELAAQMRGDKAVHARIEGYHARLKEKYRQLSARPWLPVAPDPPEPE